MDTYMNEQREWEYKGKLICLFLDDIYYFHSEARKTYVHTATRAYQIGTSIKKEAERMRELPFIRTHNAFLVHLKKLECIGSQEAVLRNGERIPVSERCWPTAKEYTKRYLNEIHNAKKRGKITKKRGICPAGLPMICECDMLLRRTNFDNFPDCQPRTSAGT